MTGKEKDFYRLAKEKAFDTERFDRMNERARKTAESRNEIRRKRHREYMREYYRSHPEQVRIWRTRRDARLRSDPERIERDRERKRENFRKRYAANRELFIDRAKEYYRTHKEKINARIRERRSEWTPERREIEKAKRHEQYLRNRARINARRRERYAYEREKETRAAG